jgi:hypothetical protein
VEDLPGVSRSWIIMAALPHARTVSSPSAVGRLKEAWTFKFYKKVKDERKKAKMTLCRPLKVLQCL